MPIPPLDQRTGRLPFRGEDAPYGATLKEVQHRFVSTQPHESARRRATIWRAFRLWHSLALTEFPGATYWLSGSFLTDRTRPSDLDVILLVDETHVRRSLFPVTSTGARVLLTHRDLEAEQPTGWTERLQPMGGLIDGFYCPTYSQDAVSYWQGAWSTEYDKQTRTPTGVRMGYLEVRAT